MKIGLTLSGGGARGIAHLGVLQALEELKIPIHQIVGTSAGAIAGALYAQGHTPEQILRIIEKTAITSLLKPSSFWNPGLFNLEKIEKILVKYLPQDSFEALQIPLSISATDIRAGETVYFSKGKLIKPLIASCCIPVMFSPIIIEGKTLVDGGILNGMPVEPLQKDCDFIIGIHTNPFDKDQTINSTRSLLERCLVLSIHANSRANFSKCDLVIEPLELKKIAAYRIDKAKEIYQAGYMEAMKMKDTIKSLIENKHSKVFESTVK